MARPTKEILAGVLRAAGLHDMADLALTGAYDDYESEHLSPIGLLVSDLQARGKVDLAIRAMNGEWDGTLEESTAWFEREGKDLLK